MAVIAERAGFLWSRFDVGRDGKTAYERHERKSRRLVICVGKVEEEVTSRRPAWKVDVHVGRWRVFGHQSNHRKSHRGNPERRGAHKNGPEEDSEGKVRPKQSGDDRGGSVAQERRRCQDGWRTTQRRCRGDGPGLQGKSGDGRRCSSTQEVYITREDLEVFGFATKCPQVHVVAQGDGETSAHRQLSKGGIRRS